MVREGGVVLAREGGVVLAREGGVEDVPLAVASLRSTGIGGVPLVPVEGVGARCGWRESGGVGRLGVANLWSFGILVRV